MEGRGISVLGIYKDEGMVFEEGIGVERSELWRFNIGVVWELVCAVALGVSVLEDLVGGFGVWSFVVGWSLATGAFIGGGLFGVFSGG